MLGGEFGPLLPVGDDYLVPLPGEDLLEMGRPGAGDPVGILRGVAVAGAAGEIDHHGHAEALGQQDGLAIDFPIDAGDLLVGVERVAMAAQGADGYAVVGEYRLKVAEGGGVLEHRQLAVRVAG